MADKVRKLARKIVHTFCDPGGPLDRAERICEVDGILRAELKSLLHWAKECTRGRHEDGECNDQCTPDNCRFTKLAAELEGWATQRGGNANEN